MAGETMLTIIGNLARDPELRTLGNGSTVANLTIASSTRQFNRQSNQWEDGDTLFMNCSAWDSQRQKFASNIVATLAKGMRVIASGRLQQRSYQAQDGSQRTVTEMLLEEIGPALTRATAQVTRVQAGGGYAGGSTYGDPNRGPAQNGWQSAMLAPTEILARQHAATLADRLEPFGVNVTLLVGGMKAKEKRIALEAIADGRANLVVGTHAVLTDTVEFKNLGLAIVDEQHRFGVRQRGLLAGKAQSPHLLVMSATPIPRTLGLLMYGDLDISVLDELPPGRKPIKTWFITGKKRRDMYGFLDKQIAAGHQVYIVCPAIEENEAMGDLQAVTTYYTETACALLPNRRIGLLHGKLKPKEKDDVMQRFKAGELDVLVSTTVIEVGVDVPNATVMVIENAERFGLSALHQLRGRVGRGAADSCCILISDNGNDAVRERLQFLCRTSDGFTVAKYDLETRGPGDFFGSAQHGLPTLRVADLVQDTRTLRVAQDEAKALLAKDPNLIDPAHRALSDEVERLFETAGAMN